MSKWGDLFNKALGPGHRGKAKVIKQDVYTWPFVRVLRTGKTKWKFEIFLEPNDRSFTSRVFEISWITERDAINRGIAENQQALENWQARQRKKNKGLREKAERVHKRFGRGHSGNIDDCRICQAYLRRQADEGGDDRRRRR